MYNDSWSTAYVYLILDPKLAKYFEMMLAANVAREVVAKQMVKDGLNPK